MSCAAPSRCGVELPRPAPHSLAGVSAAVPWHPHRRLHYTSDMLSLAKLTWSYCSIKRVRNTMVQKWLEFARGRNALGSALQLLSDNIGTIESLHKAITKSSKLYRHHLLYPRVHRGLDNQ